MSQGIKPRKRILAIILNIILLVIVICLIIWVLFGGNMNSQAVSKVESLITKQSHIEDKFKLDGYTIDNPNVIINPYGNSPLTTLVIFQTDSPVSPTVTIQGKDDLTTFSHTFDESTNHYLPIYGLYADAANTVKISYRDSATEINQELTINKVWLMPGEMQKDVSVTVTGGGNEETAPIDAHQSNSR